MTILMKTKFEPNPHVNELIHMKTDESKDEKYQYAYYTENEMITMTTTEDEIKLFHDNKSEWNNILSHKINEYMK